MNHPHAAGRYLPTAFLQAEGEFRLKARFQPKNAAARPTQLGSQSTGGDTKLSSQRLTCHPCHTPSSQKTIQSP